MSAESDDTPVHPLRSWLGVTVILMLAILGVASIKSSRELDGARSHETDLEQRVEAAKERIRVLDQRLERIANDRIVLERLAREELGMVHPGDIVIVLPKAEAEAQP